MMNRGKCVYYTVTQEAFIDGMDTGSLPKGRAKLGEKLTPDEWREFRSISGSLQWLASQTRPEVSPVVSLSNRGAETSYTDLRRLYETVDYLKATRSNGLVYQDIPVSMASLLVTYTDSSWANAGLKSQFGVFVLLAPPQASEVKTKATVLDWKSGRSTRVCRSTLAAEASAADEGADRAHVFVGAPVQRAGVQGGLQAERQARRGRQEPLRLHRVGEPERQRQAVTREHPLGAADRDS